MIPYRVETLFQFEPWANKVLFGLTIALSLAIEGGVIPEEAVTQWCVLGAGGPQAILGYQFAHAGIAHLIGNMVFLWVFGNAVCATVGNFAYLVLYLGLGAFAGAAHVLLDGNPVVGASGAIAGIVGLAVAFYPVNRVNIFYSLGLVPRTGRLGLWILALYWTAWDVIGAALHLGPVAYWAHLAGTAGGLATGLLLLATQRVQLTEFDHGSLLDFLLRREPPHKIQAARETALAELQREARAYLQAYGSAADNTPVPSPDVAQPAAVPKKRLRLKRADGTRAPEAETAGVVHFGAVHPGPAAPSPAAHPAPQAWPESLPDARYFLFDGQFRHGPLNRAEFLHRLSRSADTTRWWYWMERMPEWRQVVELETTLSRLPEELRHPLGRI